MIRKLYAIWRENRKQRSTALARALADERLSRERTEANWRDTNRAFVDEMNKHNETRQAHAKIAAELDWLYAALQGAQRLPDIPTDGETPALRTRVCQLAARRNPEGRQYEGPEAL